MTHPLIPEILALAMPIGRELDLEVVGAVFQTNQKPPVLRVDIRNLQQDTSLTDCERMSIALEAELDAAEIITGAYILEVSSPGISRQITTDREFISFKSFPVTVITLEPHLDRKEWRGKLLGRDEEAVYLNQKGKKISIPRQLVAKVQLEDKE
jgi:ribosome maturation factor RimP